MHQKLISVPTTTSKQAQRTFVSSLVGTGIEWYEFFIYGTAAALYFGPLFFPTGDPTVERLIAFASFGVAFIARPLGSVVFGHLGDRIGRRATLITTLIIMGAATGSIGLLPTYAQVGIIAPILLVALRFIQGFAVGGEWGGAVVMSVENAPARRVRLYGVAPQMGSPLGLLLSTGVMSLVALLPQADRVSWGWRIPFIVGFALVIVALVIRLKVGESPAMAQVATAKHDSVPLGDLLRKAKLPFVIGVGLQASVLGIFYIGATYLQSYSVNVLGMVQSAALFAIMLAAVVDLIALPIFAILADRIGAFRVFATGAAATALLAFPFFWAVNTANPFVLFISLALFMGIAHAAAYSVLSSMTAELFEVRYRYSGTAAASSVGSIVWGAPAPIIATALVAANGQGWEFLPVILIVLGSVSLVSVWGYRRISHRLQPLRGLEE